MKKILVLIMLLGIFIPQISFASIITQSTNQEKCQYTVEQVRADLSGLVVIGFTFRAQSQDGKRTLGFVSYHNPKSKNEKSVDALTYVLRSIDRPGMEVTLGVLYIGEKTSVTYNRKLENDTLTACFDRKVVPTPKDLIP
jgi:hypothetical protein